MPLHFSQEVCHQYWPSTITTTTTTTEGLIIGEFIVSLQDETAYSGYTERTLVVQNNKVYNTLSLLLISRSNFSN